MESHLLLGCSHKIPNGTSSAFDLSWCSTATSNTILGLCSQGSSRHVLPHAALGFSLGVGAQVGGVLLTWQAFFWLQGMIPQLYTRADAHKAKV
jgi:hypothetical protein